jgi:hypothetical protein
MREGSNASRRSPAVLAGLDVAGCAAVSAGGMLERRLMVPAVSLSLTEHPRRELMLSRITRSRRPIRLWKRSSSVSHAGCRARPQPVAGGPLDYEVDNEGHRDRCGD